MPFWMENTCGTDEDCKEGTGTEGGCAYSEYKPFNGYPYPNMESAYSVGENMDKSGSNTTNKGGPRQFQQAGLKTSGVNQPGLINSRQGQRQVGLLGQPPKSFV